MIDAAFRDELLRQLDQLPVDAQRRVLAFAQSLAEASPKGVSGNEATGFAGILSTSDAKMMMDAIDAGCEQVNL